MTQKTARFKVESHFIVELHKIDFCGGYTNRRIIAPKVDTDFPIHDYVDYGHYYDIIVSNTTIGVCDGGAIETIINVPKNMITIAGKNDTSN